MNIADCNWARMVVGRIEALEARLPPREQQAPAPDYSIGEHGEPCSCDEALDLRRQLIAANALLRQVHAEQAPTVSLLCAIGDHLDGT